MADVIADINSMFSRTFYTYNLTANFYLTNRCNLACQYCYRRSSPNVSKDYIPVADVNFYLDELKKFQNFFPSAVFTGGEIFILPMDYLRKNIQNAFDKGLIVELKTNGKWVEDVSMRTQIFDMVRSLDIPENMFAPNSYLFETVFDSFSEFDKMRFKQWCEQYGVAQGVRDLAATLKESCNIDLLVSPLALTVSVDDIVHPADSAKWYNHILEEIVKDDILRKKICLTSVTLNDKDEQSEECRLYQGYSHNALVGGIKKDPNSKNYFNGDWIYKPKYENGEFVPGCMMLAFGPDGTVWMESKINYQPIGRVPYKTENGKYKDIPTILRDIKLQLIKDYQRLG